MTRPIRLIVLLVSLLGFVSVRSSDLLGQCGVERWSVKTGTDPDAASINLSSATPTTITNLIGLPKPAHIPSTSRLQPTETTVWTVTATLTGYKVENDSDYHLVISDDAGNTMIAEIPDPACVGPGSPFAAGIASARTEFSSRFTAGNSFQEVDVPVQIKGVGMFDFLHGQRGVAPNGIEFHPVLGITFGGGPPSDFSISASPVSVSVGTGASASVGISTVVSGGFSSTLSLAASGAPPGVSTNFSTNTVAAGGVASLAIGVDSSTTPGNYTLTVTASGGGTTHSTNVNLNATSTPIGDFSLSGSLGIVSGSSTTATASISTAGGFNSDVSLSVPNLPAGISVSFNPSTIAAPGAGTSIVTIAADPSTIPGSYTITIVAASGAITRTTTLGLSVSSPGGPLVMGLVPEGVRAQRSKAFLATARTLEAATPPTLRDDDDGQIQVVSSEEAIAKARHHGGGPICNPQQHSVFLGDAWTDPAIHSRELRLANLIAPPARGLCAVPKAAAAPVSQDERIKLAKGSSLSDLEIQSRLAAMLREHRMKPPRDNTIYAVFLPPGVESKIGSATGEKDYLAYHNHFHSDQGEVRYVVVPFAANLKREMFAASRGLAQAVTNPEGNPF